MTTSYRVELFQDNFTTATAAFVADENFTAAKNLKQYTYKVPSNMELKIGDIAVVKVGTEFKCVTITDVHETPQIEYNNNSIDYKWIVSKVDTYAYNELLLQEKEIRHNLRMLSSRKQKQNILAQLQEEFGSDVTDRMKTRQLNVPNFRKHSDANRDIT